MKRIFILIADRAALYAAEALHLATINYSADVIDIRVHLLFFVALIIGHEAAMVKTLAVRRVKIRNACGVLLFWDEVSLVTLSVMTLYDGVIEGLHLPVHSKLVLQVVTITLLATSYVLQRCIFNKIKHHPDRVRGAGPAKEDQAGKGPVALPAAGAPNNNRPKGFWAKVRDLAGYMRSLFM